MKSSIFSHLQCSSFKNSRKFSKEKLKQSVFLINLFTKDQMIFKKTRVYGCLQYGIKQNSFTLLVCDLEI